ncbi:MAG: hypothetical protein AM1032_000333 [Mycoplasmataceae bacterium]|nr:MAG: hypothetical protein AM1032_000333 [Mycoplasmataceae bacterium]
MKINKQNILNLVGLTSIIINLIQYFKSPKIIIIKKEIIKEIEVEKELNNNNLEITTNENKLTLDEVNKRIESFKNKRI